MDQDGFDKQMSMTNKKEKIFNVRKLHYKQFDNQKCTPSFKSDLKPTYTPFHIKEHTQEPFSSKFLFNSKAKITKKGGQYNYQVAIISSPLYKQLTKKFNSVKQEYSREKQGRLEQLQKREQQLNKCKAQKQRIDAQRIKIIQRRDQLRFKIEEIREKNEILKNQSMQRREECRIMNMEYLKNMIIGMKYQNGMDIDPDNMTYEQLLELEEKMGSVSKGLTVEQIQKLPKKVHKQGQHDELCSVCYYNAKQGEEITELPCKHSFHTDCIKEWLVKQKVCPMCKQEIITRIQSSKKLLLSGQILTSQQQISQQSLIVDQQNLHQSISEQKLDVFNQEQKAENQLLALSGQG